jgi:hypothetical protein
VQVIPLAPFDDCKSQYSQICHKGDKNLGLIPNWEPEFTGIMNNQVEDKVRWVINSYRFDGKRRCDRRGPSNLSRTPSETGLIILSRRFFGSLILIAQKQ